MFITNISKKGLTGNNLKVVAIITMLIDHIGAASVENYLIELIHAIGYEQANIEHPNLFALDSLLRSIGRLSFPLFCFLIIEGFIYTRSKVKYLRNLFVFALLSEVPYDLAFYNTFIYTGDQNVYFTLFIGLLVITLIQIAENINLKELLFPLYVLSIVVSTLVGTRLFYNSNVAELLNQLTDNYFSRSDGPIITYMFIAAIIVILTIKLNRQSKNRFVCNALIIALGIALADLLKTDYSGFGVLTIAVMSFFRSDYIKRITSGCLILSAFNFTELSALLTIPMVYRYNGERGNNEFKYYFYAFYPVHLLILYLIDHFILGI